MITETPIRVVFNMRNGDTETYELMPSHIRDAPILVMGGKYFAFQRILRDGCAHFYEVGTPAYIEPVKMGKHPLIEPTLQTAYGRVVSLLEPDIADISVLDIAASLSKICRFNGHCLDHYSVAEHSILICRWLEAKGYGKAVQACGLMHDAPEYILGDVTKPLKSLLSPKYRDLQDAVWLKIAERFDLPKNLPDIVHEADMRILMNEKKACFRHEVSWGWEVDSLDNVKISFWDHKTAFANFVYEARRLGIPLAFKV